MDIEQLFKRMAIAYSRRGGKYSSASLTNKLFLIHLMEDLTKFANELPIPIIQINTSVLLQVSLLSIAIYQYDWYEATGKVTDKTDEYIEELGHKLRRVIRTYKSIEQLGGLYALEHAQLGSFKSSEIMAEIIKSLTFTPKSIQVSPFLSSPKTTGRNLNGDVFQDEYGPNVPCMVAKQSTTESGTTGSCVEVRRKPFGDSRSSLGGRHD